MNWHFSTASMQATPKPASRRRSVLAVEALEDRSVPATLAMGFTEQTVAGGLSEATAMEIAPDGRIFVTEQTGKLRIIDTNNQLLATPFVTLTVDSAGERGLLGITFDPQFATNQFLYVYYTVNVGGASHNRVSRFTANGNVAQAGSERVIVDLEVLSSATNHNGGALHIGKDNKLYVGVGENANGANAQSLTTRLGKILRYNLDGTIPTDNPKTFGSLGTTSGIYDAIWAVGLRNPFSFSVQPGTGRLFINDVGQNTYEEIDNGVAGANYGWPNAEGPSSNPAYTNPVFYYGHGSGTSLGFAITGGSFYNPATTQFPADYTGDYFFADFVNSWIRRLDPATGSVTLLASNLSNPVDLKVDSAGNLLYLARGTGAVNKIQYAATPEQVFVSALYRDILGRTGASVDIDYWSGQVISQGRNSVSNRISRSQESLGRMVDNVYVQMLARPADPGGRSFFVGQMANGQTLEQIIARIAGSGEYASRATALEHTGNGDADFVRSLYRLLLQRTNETASQVNDWVARITTRGREGVASGFLFSSEFRGNSVSSFYGPAVPLPFFRNFLKRSTGPTSGEISGWTSTGADLLTIEVLFASSDEYFVHG